jgi:hypothetical protein
MAQEMEREDHEPMGTLAVIGPLTFLAFPVAAQSKLVSTF